jgi:hypothetical protein
MPVKRSAEDVERHIQSVGFAETMRQAHDGKLERLHDYFRAYLPEDHADAIIEWAKRRLRHDLNRPPTPERAAEDLIIALARTRLKFERQRGPLPRGSYQRVIDWSATQLAEDGELNRSDPERIDYRRIRNAVGRGTKPRRV